MIETPPRIKPEDIAKHVAELLKKGPSPLDNLIREANEEYLYWEKIKYKQIPESYDPHDLWVRIKLDRRAKSIAVSKDYDITFALTNKMQQICHDLDMEFGGSWGADDLIPAKSSRQYLVSSLMEEAISSSQMEGASTTRKIAKEMLQKGKTPINKSQQMIANNYSTIRFIVENKDRPLTKELLLQVHRLMTEKTLYSDEDSGRFRQNDDVVVADGITNEIVHTPPSYEDIPNFVEWLCKFFNEKDTDLFIHPIIKGIIIHFMITYIHPFVDGNGRTARALFYWYMLRQGYWLTEYLSISKIISTSKKTYEKAFLYTEADDMDMGYFITYNLKVLQDAFKNFKEYLIDKQKKQEETNKYLRIEGVNERQSQIIAMFVSGPDRIVTIKELQNKFSITPTTAKNDINGLLHAEILSEISLNKVKKGYIKGQKFDEIIQKIHKLSSDS